MQLDAWFETVAEGQHTLTLLFSTLFEWMMQVVSRQQPSRGAPVRMSLQGRSGARRAV